ncbi:unnamed protein product [Cyprideis torosa]|uniref:Uncharacterized protein n=1 Tax=Cyprideis torosa TaxID=163714 RepID=A0A7R8WE37_9CRUS|nr:unnamed protein product [Cyprideis torosa]CAG0889285.1 unnamed protein product [Cyprideis torosa]
MDEFTLLRDLLECSVCLENLDATSKILPCQHTFCKRCLEEILQSRGELRCPECRVLYPGHPDIDSLPTNVTLMRVLEGMKQLKSGGSGGVNAAGSIAQPIELLKPRPLPFLIPTPSPGIPVRPNQRPSLAPPRFVDPPTASQVRPPLPRFNLSASATSSVPTARALLDFEARQTNELPFKKGDLIRLLRSLNNGLFLEGEIHGRRGVFPASLVQVLLPLPASSTSSSSIIPSGTPISNAPITASTITTTTTTSSSNHHLKVPECRALYDFPTSTTEDTADCLSFKEGDVIKVLRRVDANWAEGRLAAQIGIFPISFVDMNASASLLMKLSLFAESGVGRRAPPTPTETVNPRNPFLDNSTAATTSSPASTAPSLTSTTASQRSPLNSRITSEELRALLGTHIPSQSPPSTSATPSATCVPESTILTSTLASTTSSAATSSASFVSTPLATVLRSDDPPHPPRRSEEGRRHSLDPLSSASNQFSEAEAVPPPIPLPLWGRAISDGQAISGGEGNRRSDPPSSTGPVDRPSRASPPTIPPPAPAEKPALYVAIHPYKPQKGDELELSLNELYTVTEKCMDGWFRGTAVRTKKSGVFPGNYVKPVRSPPQARHSAPPPSVGSAAPSLGQQTASSSSSLWDPLPPRVVPPPPNVTIGVPSSSTSKPTPPSKNLMKKLAAGMSGRRKSGGGSALGFDDDFTSSTVATTTATTTTTTTSKPSTASIPSGGYHVRLEQLPSSSSENRHSSSSSSSQRPRSPRSTSDAAVANGDSASVVERVCCIVPYPANSNRELDLKIGDIISVYKKRSDGWFIGKQQRTGLTGLFPGSFVAPLGSS